MQAFLSLLQAAIRMHMHYRAPLIKTLQVRIAAALQQISNPFSDYIMTLQLIITLDHCKRL